MENKNETIWITIPDEKVPARSLPQEEAHENPDKVENKLFWGLGLVALVAFSMLLFAPQQFAHLMQGQLFDGGFQVIPDYDQQESSEFFGQSGDSETTAPDETTDSEAETVGTEGETTSTENVIEAESDAVSIQITPLADTEVPVSDPETTPSANTSQEVVSTAEEVQEVEATTDTEDVAVTDESAEVAVSPAVQAELDALKKMQEENQALIAQLTQMLAGGLHGAAGSTQISPSLQGNTQNQQFSNQPAGSYRYNTHTVTVSPYDVLRDRQALQAQFQTNTQMASVQDYTNANYNPVLAGVHGQPDSGPAEAMMIAILLSSIGVLVWGTMRAVRA